MVNLGYNKKKFFHFCFEFSLDFINISCKSGLAMADVAQLVEPRFVVPVVVSSSLIVRPIFSTCW